ncbi:MULTISPECIES: hypothetical protein [unclassified Pseudoxanthomonas]|uniref:hypothetical protein n=1 Tax=unclassified Pseudoxanthomonas TaxID=2645906 RepID=UPI0030768958
MPAEVPLQFASKHLSSTSAKIGLTPVGRSRLRVRQAWHRKRFLWRIACLMGVLAWNTAMVAGERIGPLTATDAFVADDLDKSHSHCQRDRDTERTDLSDDTFGHVRDEMPWITVRSAASTSLPVWWYYILQPLELPPPIA